MRPQKIALVVHGGYQSDGAELCELYVKIVDFWAIGHLGWVSDRCTLTAESEIETDVLIWD